MKKKINLINIKINQSSKKKLSKLNLRNKIAIGDWCELIENIYLNKKDYKFLDFNNWHNLKKKSQDSHLIMTTYDYFLKFLTFKLNEIHKKKETQKFWEILLGRWLFAYIHNIYSRWQIVQEIKKDFRIETLITSEYEDLDFIPNTSQDSHWIMMSPYNDYWNTLIFNKIIKFMFKKKIKIRYIKKQKIKLKKNYSYNSIFFSNVINFSLNKKIFFYDLSLDKKIRFLLMVQNYFLNFHLCKKKINLKNKTNKELRNQLRPKKKVFKNEFFKFLHLDIIFRVPKIFLENFDDLNNTYRSLNWPKKPDYIISSYAQYYDEVFKYYCAKKNQKI